MIPWEKWFDDERSFEQVVVRLLVVYALLQCGLGVHTPGSDLMVYAAVPKDVTIEELTAAQKKL